MELLNNTRVCMERAVEKLLIKLNPSHMKDTALSTENFVKVDHRLPTCSCTLVVSG